MGDEKRPLLVIIPAFNEEKSIGGVIRDILGLPIKLDLLVVDDGSTDATAAIARGEGAIVISLPFNSGYGVALQTAYKYAVKHNYGFAIQLDADGQHDAGCILDLARQIDSGAADIVIGSRFLNSSAYKTDFLRRIGIKFYASVVSLVMRQKITDPTSGFQGLSLEALKLYCTDIFPSDFPDADMLIFSYLCGLRIKELPVIMYESPSYKLQMHKGFTILYYVFKMTLSILVTLLRGKPRKEVCDVI